MVLLNLGVLTVFSQDCKTEWSKILASGVSFTITSNYTQTFANNYTQAFAYSGLSLNNLGDYDSCKNLEYAKYALLWYNTFPKEVIGLCGPDICTKNDYSNVSALIPTLPSPEIVYFSKEYQSENYGSLSTGAIVMISFISILAFVVIVATVADYCLKDDGKGSTVITYLL